ncbi:MAG TPA: glycosyltransferase family 4 protein [Candidatus Acidoferrales bacterium]|jgi:glycosyltransferase involved in cell wall biosynthesis|nr:glycosyltransferase family 4 protein [Candidatus Acidoferrales bacterium]
MRPLHVLLLNQYFPPDTAATAGCAALIANVLAERHRVTVLAGRPSYDPVNHHSRYIFKEELDGNLAIGRVGSTAFPRRRMKGRLSNYFSYLALAGPRAVSINADLVLAMTDPPIEGIFGAAVAKFLGRRFVYNIRDLYPDVALAANIVRPGLWTAAWEDSHRRALRQAARVIVLGEDMRERIAAKGIDPARVTVIRDAVPFPEIIPRPDENIVRDIRGAFRFVLVHAGNLGFSGSWLTLIRATQMLEAENVGLVFVGEGAMKKQVQQFAQNCGNVRFLPFRPASDLSAVMAAGDLHVVTIRRGLEGMVVPSKMYNILAHGRPILSVASKDADVSRLACQYGFGFVVDPDDPIEIAQVVRSVLNAPDRLRSMSHQARKLAKIFERSRELAKFVDVIEEVGNQHRFRE